MVSLNSRYGGDVGLQKLICLQSALFNFQSLLLVLLLVICTSTYAHATFPKIMDRNREGLVYVCVAEQQEEANVLLR